MLRLTRSILRKKISKRQQAVTSLSSPNLQRPWNDLSNLTAAEKEELLHGAWRQDKPIELRRTAHAPPVEASATPGAAAAVAEEAPLSFATDEEAARYLQEEDEDEQQELSFPTLSLAQQFFTDLAQTADEELEEGGAANARPQSDEERAEETRDVHRHFFADYYVHQQMVAEEDRYSFIDLMTRPGAAAFEVNSERALARLTVRDQLERQYGHSCFEPSTFSPCVVLLSQSPTQPLGAAPRVPYTAATSLLAQQEAREVEEKKLLNHPAPPPQAVAVEEQVEEVDVLSDLLQDDVSLIAPLPATTTVAETKSVASTVAPAASLPVSLDHIYWLQRQVASGSLIPTDLLACLVARLATAAAVLYTRGNEGAVVPLVLDLTAATGKTDWSSDVAQYARTAAPREDVVVVVAGKRAPPPPRTSHARGKKQHKREEPEVELAEASAVSTSETAVNLLHVRPTQPRRPWTLFPRELQQPCAVVLCAPETTEDGVRPQFLFGDSDPASVVEQLPVNQYVTVAQTLAERFDRQQKALQYALEMAAQTADGQQQHHRGGGEGEELLPPRNAGFVVYATRSMNPIENEAVVCAVLQQLSQRPRYGLQVDCVPLRGREAASDVVTGSVRGEELRALLNHGLPGLTTWCGLEGGPSEMEATCYSEELRQRVAAASWRSLPHVCAQDDGAYCVLLRVRPTSLSLPLPSVTAAREEEEKEDSEEAASVVPCVVTGGTPSLHDSAPILAHTAVRRVMTAHTAAVYQAVQRCQDFTCSTAGVMVGYGDADRCEWSSAISCPAVQHALTAASLLVPVPCPIPVLRTLLRDGKWSGRLDEMDSWGAAPISSAHPQAVLLRPEVPVTALPEGQALHPALLEELTDVGVVAEATVDDARLRMWLRLRVPDAMPDAPRQRDALQEWSVGLRDALLYVQRRLGIEETVETAEARKAEAQQEDKPSSGAQLPGEEPISWEEGDFEVLPVSRRPAAPQGSAPREKEEPVDVFSREAEMSVANFMAQLEKERGGQVRPQDWSAYAPRSRGAKRW